MLFLVVSHGLHAATLIPASACCKGNRYTYQVMAISQLSETEGEPQTHSKAKFYLKREVTLPPLSARAVLPMRWMKSMALGAKSDWIT